ncbi:hypothetical protein BpHYR1_020677 [Brachionus plicatilis]|uniref:Uncharacterized protein n=1 Tax=Brachionus plicatilis TaxID=10195 RepID=A0A3M7T757_BRAPC|nr:hypothetical protein BpHYR1_020677 [Brachionus plicatilis]
MASERDRFLEKIPPQHLLVIVKQIQLFVLYPGILGFVGNNYHGQYQRSQYHYKNKQIKPRLIDGFYYLIVASWLGQVEKCSECHSHSKDRFECDNKRQIKFGAFLSSAIFLPLNRWLVWDVSGWRAREPLP